MTITLEAIRAAGGIVHSDGNIFFRDISMLQGLAGAAPAAVAPQGKYPPLPKVGPIGYASVVDVESYAKSMSIGPHLPGVRDVALWTTDQMRAYFDLGRQPAAAPALEAPAAPGVPAGFALVPIEPTQQMLDAGRWSGAGSVSIQEEWARKEVWSRMLATVAPPPAAYADDLVALVVNLVQALSAAAPDNDLASHALDYLKRNGLQGSPLQAAGAAPQAPAAPSAVATQVIENLLQLARIVNTAVEDWGETKEDDSMEVIFHKEEADKMEAILEFFDSLPDAPEGEGVILSGPSRAARVLRAMEAPAAPVVVDEGHLSDELRELITGMTVSVDVSTGGHDASNRLFGEVTEVMQYDGGSDKHKVVLLVQSPEANFKAAPAAPDDVLCYIRPGATLPERHGFEVCRATDAGAMAVTGDGRAVVRAVPASKRIGQILNPASDQSQDAGAVVVAEIMSNGYNGQVLWKGKVPPVGTLLYAAPQAAPAAPAVDASDKALLDFLRDTSCDLRSIDVPTGGDDSDVHWRVIEHYMSEPREREIGRSWSDDPREAIRAAIAAQAKEGGA